MFIKHLSKPKILQDLPVNFLITVFQHAMEELCVNYDVG